MMKPWQGLPPYPRWIVSEHQIIACMGILHQLEVFVQIPLHQPFNFVLLQCGTSWSASSGKLCPHEGLKIHFMMTESSLANSCLQVLWKFRSTTCKFHKWLHWAEEIA